jgi:predicted Zn finger-like uncharacterized protein
MSESPSHFVAVCPNCLVSLRVQASYNGRHVRCKHCDHKFRALSPDLPSSTTPSSHEHSTSPLGVPVPDPERITAVCPHCSAALSVRKAYAGQYVRCKKCDQKFLVPNVIEPRTEPPGIAEPSAASDDLFDQLYRELDRLEPTGPEPQDNAAAEEAPSPAAAAALPAEGSPAGQPDTELLDRLAAVESTRDAALAELEQLLDDHGRLRQQLEHQQAELERLRAEGVEPERGLHGSHQEAAGQLQQRVEELEAELAGRGDLAGRLAAQDSELQEARQQIDAMGQQAGELEQSRSAVNSERDSLRREIESVQRELESLREELGNALAERDSHRDQAQSRDQALAGSEVRIQGLTEQLRSVDEDRLARTAEIERLQAETERLQGENQHLGTERQRLQAEIERLEGERQRLEAERQGLDAERGRLEADRQAATERADQLHAEFGHRERGLGEEADRLRGELDDLRRRLADAEQARQDETNQRGEQLRQLDDRHQAALSENASLQATIQQHLESLERERAGHGQAMEARETELRAESHSALDAERARHAEELSRVEARLNEAAEQVERLKAEILTLAQTRPAHDADLEAARLEIQDLRSKLAETETTKRSMSSLLEGMGIRLH